MMWSDLKFMKSVENVFISESAFVSNLCRSFAEKTIGHFWILGPQFSKIKRHMHTHTDDTVGRMW